MCIIIPISLTVCGIPQIENNESVFFHPRIITKLFQFFEVHVTRYMSLGKVFQGFVVLFEKNENVCVLSDTVFCYFIIIIIIIMTGISCALDTESQSTSAAKTAS